MKTLHIRPFVYVLLVILSMSMPLKAETQDYRFAVVNNDTVATLDKVTFKVKPGDDLFGVKADGSTYHILDVERSTLRMTVGTTYEITLYVDDEPLGTKTLQISPSTPKTIELFLDKITATKTPDSDQPSSPLREPRKENIENLEDVIVRERFERKETSKNTMRSEEMKFSAGSGGDPLKALKSLPGVVSTGSAFFEGLYVRGGNQEDVLYILDGIPIGNPYHSVGFYSVFSSESISGVDFYPSAYPYSFGLGQGAAINMTGRDAFAEAFKLKLDLNIGVSSINIEIPIIKDTLTFLGSFRRSNYELYFFIATNVSEDIASFLNFPAPVFFNNYNKLQWKINGEHTLDLSTVTKYDHLEVASPFDVEDEAGEERPVFIENAFTGYWNTTAITETWETDIFRNRLVISRLFERDTVFLFGSTFSEFDQVLWNVSDNFIIQLRDWLNLELGFSWIYESEEGRNRTFTPEELTESFIEAAEATSDYENITNSIAFFSRGTLTELDDYSRHLLSAYTGIGLRLGAFTFNPGAFAAYNFLGERFFVDPRLEVIWQLFETFNVFGRVGQYTQLPDFLVLLPMQFPQQNDPKILNPTTMHYVLGTESTWFDTIIKVEAYYQYGTNQILFNPDYDDDDPIDFDSNPYTVNTGKNRGYGAEISIRRRVYKKFFAWATYTFSSAERYEYELDNATSRPINNLRWIHYDQDVTHQATLTSSWKITKNWRIGARLNMSTGKPYTENILVFDDRNGNGEIDKEERELRYSTDNDNRNEVRYPFIFRFDMRMDYTVSLWNKVDMSIYLDVWSLEFFFRQNILGYQTSTDYLNNTAYDAYNPSSFDSDNQLILPVDTLTPDPYIPPILPLIGVEFSF